MDISLDETQQIIEGTRDEVEPCCSIAFIYLFFYLSGFDVFFKVVNIFEGGQ